MSTPYDDLPREEAGETAFEGVRSMSATEADLRAKLEACEKERDEAKRNLRWKENELNAGAENARRSCMELFEQRDTALARVAELERDGDVIWKDLLEWKRRSENQAATIEQLQSALLAAKADGERLREVLERIASGYYTDAAGYNLTKEAKDALTPERHEA